MALIILPFRLGEFARPYLIAERPRLRVSSAPVGRGRARDGRALHGRAARRDARRCPTARRACGCPDGRRDVSLAFAALLAFLVLGYRNRALAVRLRRRSCGRSRPRRRHAWPGCSTRSSTACGSCRAGASSRSSSCSPPRTGPSTRGASRCSPGLRVRASTPWRPHDPGRACRGGRDPRRSGDGRDVPGEIVLGSLFAAREASQRGRGVRERALGGADGAAGRARALLPVLRHIQIGRLFAAPAAMEAGPGGGGGGGSGAPGASAGARACGGARRSRRR